MYKEILRSNTTQEHLVLLLPQYGGWEWAKTWEEGRERRGWAKCPGKRWESSPPQTGRADLRLDFQAVQVASGSHICTCRSCFMCCSLVHRLFWLVVSSRILVSNLRFCSFCKVYVSCNLCLYLCNCFLRSLERKQDWVRVVGGLSLTPIWLHKSSFCSLQGPFCRLRLLLESPPCFLQSVIIHYTSNKAFDFPITSLWSKTAVSSLALPRPFLHLFFCIVFLCIQLQSSLVKLQVFIFSLALISERTHSYTFCFIYILPNHFIAHYFTILKTHLPCLSPRFLVLSHSRYMINMALFFDQFCWHINKICGSKRSDTEQQQPSGSSISEPLNS